MVAFFLSTRFQNLVFFLQNESFFAPSVAVCSTAIWTWTFDAISILATRKQILVHETDARHGILYWGKGWTINVKNTNSGVKNTASKHNICRYTLCWILPTNCTRRSELNAKRLRSIPNLLGVNTVDNLKIAVSLDLLWFSSKNYWILCEQKL